MSRKFFIAGNWKMNKTAVEAVAAVKKLAELTVGVQIDMGLFPVATALADSAKAAEGSDIIIGSQNMHFEKSGAFTGELSADILKETGITHVIIGHSERRQYFAETDETVNKRTKAVLNAGFIPVTCIGETLEERENGDMEKILKRQITGALAGLTSEEIAKIVLAYEPVWAIGTGVTASSEQAQEAHLFIRNLVAEIANQQTADSVRILYGGSVKPGNVTELIQQPDIDGGLVGGASLEMSDFSQIINNANEVYSQ